MEHQLLTDRFLETLKKTQTNWQNDKELVKIIRKMEQGKNLKNKEFSKIQWVLWEKGHCHY